MSMFGPPEQQIEILRRLDLSHEPWQVKHFDHDRKKWIYELCDGRNGLNTLVQRIVREIAE
jgi:hypothetical protein